MACLVFANVVLRYASGNSILWVEEASRYVMIWLTFLGCGLVLRYGGHIGIDSLQDRFPRLAARLRILIAALMFLFFAIMVWLGTVYSLRTWTQTTPVMEITVGAVYLAMPIGFALMMVHLAIMIGQYVRTRPFMHDAEFDADAAKL